jgi:hypothetical protein
MVSDTDFRRILHSHPAYALREYIRMHNINGYSKMKKAEIIDVMMYYKSRFRHIKRYVRPKREPRAPRATTAPPTAPPRPARPSAEELANIGSGLARRRR